MDLPQFLKKAREKKGWSQAQLAEKLGVSAGTVGSWESGSGHGMRVERMRQVAAILDVKLIELMQAAA